MSRLGGRLPHYITLEEDTGTTRDARGHKTSSWTERGFAYAKIERLAGRQLEMAQQLHDLASHRITTRVQSELSLDESWRVKFEGRVLNIVTVERVDERNHEWRMIVAEDNSQA